MPPTPPNTTSRLKVHYSGPAAGEHTMLFHGTNPGDSVALSTAAIDFLNEVSGLCWNTTNFHSAEFAAAGSPFFFPISWTPIIVSSANVFGTNDDPAFFVQWGGRDGAGVRVKLYLFECALTPNPNMRYEAGDNPAVDGGVSVLQASVAVIRTIAAGSPAWKTYANVGSNDKIVHDARRSG